MSARSLYAWILAVGIIALGALQLWFGELNHDEGWYLYASRLVAEGQLPYRDFAFTQTPVLPFVYAIASPLTEWQGVAAGRAVTFLFGALSMLLTFRLARRLAPDPESRWIAGFLACAMLGLNVYHSYFTTVVKTYALCACFLVGSFLALESAIRTRRVWCAGLSGLLLVAAAGTRLSAGAAGPMMLLGLWFGFDRAFRREAIAYAIGGSLAALLIFGTPAWAAFESFRFCIFEYHAGREAGSFSQQLALKLGFLARFAQGYPIPLALLVVALLTRRRSAGSASPSRSLGGVMLGSFGAITALHMAAPFPYDDYQVLAVPLLIAYVSPFIGGLLTRRANPLTPHTLGLGVLLIAGIAALGSPILQSWKVQGRDRIWWIFKPQSDLAELRQVAAKLRSSSDPQGDLLTADLYLAVEAGRRVPPGLEMGPFSFYPDMSDERAERLHVLNENSLVHLLTSHAPIDAALSGYAFSIHSPSVVPVSPDLQARIDALVSARYALVDTVPEFGQGHTTLRILRRKDQAP